MAIKRKDKLIVSFNAGKKTDISRIQIERIQKLKNVEMSEYIRGLIKKDVVAKNGLYKEIIIESKEQELKVIGLEIMELAIKKSRLEQELDELKK
jgi:tRNA A37 threonylcarbamoyladenosine dehydratase